ncbi:MAG TPA: hypothetical protein VJT74_08000 [Pyrinomonadaceae bacterium]|nr:hypothetical protein [Pyrinomonadaceae bacterium]
MVTERIELPATQNSYLTPRLLGTVGMVCAPMLFVSGFLYALGDGTAALAASALGMLYLVGWAASAAGMRQLRVAGRLSGAVFAVQLVGLSLALVFNVLEMAGANPDTLFFRVTDMAWPVSHLFMLVVGALVLTARVWRGWRSWTPWLCGLALPVFFGARPLLGGEVGGFIFGVLTAIAFTLLGYAVRTSARNAV